MPPPSPRLPRARPYGRRTLTVLLAALAACVPAACGDEDPFAEAPSEPTKARFISEADLICRSAERDVRQQVATELEGAGAETLSDPELARIAEEIVIPITEDELAQIQELPQPREDRALLEEIFTVAERELDELRADPASIEDPETVFGDAAELADRYGFQDCADAG